MADFDITKLSPEQLANLRMQLGMPAETQQRSPVARQLNNLYPVSTKDRIGCPHFEPSAHLPPEGMTIPPWPRLYWDPRGVERRIESLEHMQQVVGPGWSDVPPMANAISDEDRLKAEIALLSPEDREFLLVSVKKQKMDDLKSRMTGMSNDAIAGLMPAKPEPVEKTKTKAS